MHAPYSSISAPTTGVAGPLCASRSFFLRSSACASATFSVSRAAMDAMRLLSSPPLSSTPYGTSDMSRLRTAASRLSRRSVRSADRVGMGASGPSASPSHHEGWK